MWKTGFSAHSYGFRPGRSAAQAVKAAQVHIQSGERWVVEVDLEKFFDRVNHDVLMARVARRVKGRRMLRLILRPRQWKMPRARLRKLTALGLDRERAGESAFNCRGSWWNAGASHLNAALPTAYFRRLGLISLLEEVQ